MDNEEASIPESSHILSKFTTYSKAEVISTRAGIDK